MTHIGTEKMDRLKIGDIIKTKSGIVGVVAAIYRESEKSVDGHEYKIGYESETIQQIAKENGDRITALKYFTRQDLILLRSNDIPTGRINQYGFGI